MMAIAAIIARLWAGLRGYKYVKSSGLLARQPEHPGATVDHSGNFKFKNRKQRREIRVYKINRGKLKSASRTTIVQKREFEAQVALNKSKRRMLERDKERLQKLAAKQIQEIQNETDRQHARAEGAQ